MKDQKSKIKNNAKKYLLKRIFSFNNPYLSYFISHFSSSQGQSLITLLFFMIISVTITSAAIIVLLVNALGTTVYQEGTITYYAAETGIENALLRLLRDPSYKGESFTVDQTTVTTQVTGTNPLTITATAKNNAVIRTIEVQVSYANNVLDVLSWKEK